MLFVFIYRKGEEVRIKRFYSIRMYPQGYSHHWETCWHLIGLAGKRQKKMELVFLSQSICFCLYQYSVEWYGLETLQMFYQIDSHSYWTKSCRSFVVWELSAYYLRWEDESVSERVSIEWIVVTARVVRIMREAMRAVTAVVFHNKIRKVFFIEKK